jgi:predicted DCC family thiol-disulfide oxidoreductase YuxK
MKRLCVLYDGSCGFCVRCREWLSTQPAYVELEFVAAGSHEAARRFPSLADANQKEELIAIDDEGGVYRGSDAFIICLWALTEHRELALDLASPALRPFARAAFGLLSSGRKWISRLFGFKSEDDVRATLEDEPGET